MARTFRLGVERRTGNRSGSTITVAENVALLAWLMAFFFFYPPNCGFPCLALGPPPPPIDRRKGLTKTYGELEAAVVCLLAPVAGFLGGDTAATAAEEVKDRDVAGWAAARRAATAWRPRSILVFCFEGQGRD